MERFKPKNYFLRLRPEVHEEPGLFLTGQDVTSDGLLGAAIGGILCAGKVLGEHNPFSLLRKLPDEHVKKCEENNVQLKEQSK